MLTLSNFITIEQRFARSINLERDAGQVEPLNDYKITPSTINVLENIANVALNGSSGGAWSLVGPFGSGKSSAALLVDAAFGPSSTARKLTWSIIDEASPETGKLIQQAHAKYSTTKGGFNRGLVTASREPVSHTLLKALYFATAQNNGKDKGKKYLAKMDKFRDVFEKIISINISEIDKYSEIILDTAKCLAEDAPLLLIIDEFGKNIEAIIESEGIDPYILQQLAEAGQGNGLPIFLLTLQHQSFENYASSNDFAGVREWGKIQGRFENITFIESPQQLRALISSAIEIKDKEMLSRINRWAQNRAKELLPLNIPEVIDDKEIASYYPLHPLSALVLPELCIRCGQHERSLFSFLTDGNSSSALSFVHKTVLPDRGSLPTIGLDIIFDYFINSDGSGTLFAGKSSKWIEIATRIRDISSLTKRQLKLAKSIALLNLISTGGVLRASKNILSLIDKKAEKILNELEELGVITYRKFADEYRIWQGTDLNIQQLFDEGMEQTKHQTLAEILMVIAKPAPQIAARHSAQTNTLRIFNRRYIENLDEVGRIDLFSPFDGELLFATEKDLEISDTVLLSREDKPILVAIPNDIVELEKIAREVMSAYFVLNHSTVRADWVAQNEISERISSLCSKLDFSIKKTFSADSCKWVFLNCKKELTVGRGSSVLSSAADISYDKAPIIMNEMINRSELTSQGIKARRELLSAMIENGAENNLGLSGYGPEVAIYRSFLESTGLHYQEASTGKMSFRKPKETTLCEAWKILDEDFNLAKLHRVNLGEIYETLLSPPIGMKAGVIPVLLTASLLANEDSIAIYEHGTFVPELTSYISERMVRNPDHFEIKNFSNYVGARKHFIDSLADGIGVEHKLVSKRVSNILSVVNFLIAKISQLDNFTLNTKNLTKKSLLVRDALLSAVEPDELIFSTLPVSLDLPPVNIKSRKYDYSSEFVIKLSETLEELEQYFHQLLARLLNILLEVSGEPSRKAIAGQAIVIQDEIINPEIRAFVLALANDTIEDDLDWAKTVATVVTNKAPAEWIDEDLKIFENEIASLMSNFQRLVALHAERRASGGRPFDSLRISITHSDGTEHIRLISIDKTERSRLEAEAENMISKLMDTAKSPLASENAVLSVIGEKLITKERQKFDSSAIINSTQSTMHISKKRQVENG